MLQTAPITERKMGMNATGHAFRVLSATLYSDKVLAAVRETVNNARDAHIMADCLDRPFHIHLPTRAEPFWAVRDFGPGLSDEEIGTIYTTYFLSTKARHSQKFAGQLGLGTKAPLAYSESFGVTSFYHGMKRSYEIFFDSNSEPTISPAVAEPTSEPNGLEVRIVVQPEDFREFIGKTETALAFFDPQPIISGGSINPGRPTPMFEGSFYRTNQSKSAEVRAVMGVIAYPIDPKKLPNLSPDVLALFELPLDIDFELGALDFVPSREGLSYDREKTIPTLTRVLKQVAKDLPKSVDAHFADHQREIDVRRAFKRLMGVSGVRATLKFTHGIRWRGVNVTDEDFRLDLRKFPGVVVTVIEPGRSGGLSVSRKATYLNENEVRIKTVGSVVLFDNDRKRSGLPAVREALRSYGGHGGSRASYRVDDGSAVYIVDGPDAERARFIAAVEGTTVRQTSSLFAPKSERKPVMAKRLWTFRANTDLLEKDNLKNTTFDLDEGGYYIVTSRGEAETWGNDRVQIALKAAIRSGLFDPNLDTLAVVPSTLANRFRKAPGWEDLYTTLERRARDIIAETDFSSVAYHEAVDDLNLWGDIPVVLEGMSERLAEDHPIRQFHESLTAKDHTRELMQERQSLARAFRIFLTIDKNCEYRPSVIWDRLNRIYPMMELGFGRHHDYEVRDEKRAENIRKLVEYVELVDGLSVRSIREPATVRAPRVVREKGPSRARVIWTQSQKNRAQALKENGASFSTIAASLNANFGSTFKRSDIANLFHRALKQAA